MKCRIQMVTTVALNPVACGDQPTFTSMTSEHTMNADLQIPADTLSIEQQPQYVFVVDADLVQVGGGTPAVEY